jgi:hypothetical protein
MQLSMDRSEKIWTYLFESPMVGRFFKTGDRRHKESDILDSLRKNLILFTKYLFFKKTLNELDQTARYI